MRAKYYRAAKRKHDVISRLMDEKRKGKEVVYRKFTPEDSIISSIIEIFPQTIPEKIIIFTKPIPNYKFSNKHLIKEIHHSYRKNKKFLVVNYQEKSCDLLQELEISYIVKYKIILTK